jgi:hypothetical protein
VAVVFAGDACLAGFGDVHGDFLTNQGVITIILLPYACTMDSKSVNKEIRRI